MLLKLGEHLLRNGHVCSRNEIRQDNFIETDHDGEYPTSAQGLEILIHSPGNDPKWKGPYVESSTVPTDAWGNPLQYAFPGPNHPNGERPDISSWGPDKTAGTDDDINNWSVQR